MEAPEACPACGAPSIANATTAADRKTDRLRWRCAGVSGVSCGYEWTEKRAEDEPDANQGAGLSGHERKTS